LDPLAPLGHVASGLVSLRSCSMKKGFAVIATALVFGGAAAAHHGWGSYDSARLIKVEGPVLALKYQNPHADLVMNRDGKKWDIVLAPLSRMEARGLKREDIEVGKVVTVEGYPRKDGTPEIRAERITAGGKTVELR
jgi:hypothetical protein